MERRDGILARNERVVFQLDAGPLGRIALVMVGAGGVGNIRLAPALGGGDSADWRSAREPRRVELSGVPVARGDELGAFRLGSTVVLVFEPGRAELTGEIGDALRFGQRIGTALAAPAGPGGGGVA
jgi:phosphatidylserine decarboxylase